MRVWVQFDKYCLQLDGPVGISYIKNELFNDNAHRVYFTYNGRKLLENAIIEEGVVRAYSRMLGGKGGFGSMLRAIGAQIEKTTNREACRDLSGRRLRDINEEKRLKNWIAQQAEREREAAEKRKKKLERLCFEPKHDFSDQNYEKERTELTEKINDAVEQGFRSASTSTSTSESKRKLEPQGGSQIKKTKSCLWVDDFDEEDISSDDSDGGTEEIQAKKKKKNGDNKKSTSFQNVDEEVPIKTKKDAESVQDKCSQEVIENKSKNHEEGNDTMNENLSRGHVFSSEKSKDTLAAEDVPQSPEGNMSEVCSENSSCERDSGVASNAPC